MTFLSPLSVHESMKKWWVVRRSQILWLLFGAIFFLSRKNHIIHTLWIFFWLLKAAKHSYVIITSQLNAALDCWMFSHNVYYDALIKNHNNVSWSSKKELKHQKYMLCYVWCQKENQWHVSISLFSIYYLFRLKHEEHFSFDVEI